MARLVSENERLPRSSRYELLVRLASGGMATVFIGQLRSAAGFTRLVAIKRAHPHMVEQRGFSDMFVNEARLASLLRHRNIVSVTDVESAGDELVMVMDYVDGATLSELLATTAPGSGGGAPGASSGGGPPLPARVAVKIVTDACAGLEAAHDLRSEDGAPLHLVHRDVSPHNILVGSDGAALLTDFGIAKAVHSKSYTETGALKGKLAYMAPEYLRGDPATQATDVFAMGVVLWEALAGERLFVGANEPETIQKVLSEELAPPVSTFAPIDAALEAIVARAVSKRPDDRFPTAGSLRSALERYAADSGDAATASDVADAVKALMGATLEQRRGLVRAALAARDAIPSSDGRPNEAAIGDRTETLPATRRAAAGAERTARPASDVTSGTGVSVGAHAPSPAPRRRALYAAAALGTLAITGVVSYGIRDGGPPNARTSSSSAPPAPSLETTSTSEPARATATSTPVPAMESARPDVDPPTADSIASSPVRRPPPTKTTSPSTATTAATTATATAVTNPTSSGPAWARCNPYKVPPDPNCR